MKKVLHVIDSLHLGGAQEVVMNLATCGNRDRFTHEVATLHGRGIYWDRLAEVGVPLHSLSPHKLLPIYIPALAGLLQRRQFHVLHCHLIATNIIAKPIGAFFRVPLILNHDHTNDPKRGNSPWLLALDRWANRCATHHVAVSTSCRDFLVFRESIPPGDVTLVVNGIDLSRFRAGNPDRAAARSALDIPDGGILISGVGRLNAQKNFSLFLEIAAGVIRTHPGARFLIAGTGPEAESLRILAARLGLGDMVRFAGYIADPRLVYAASDILLMPSVFEGLPMTLLEAMAMEVPVVASRLDGIAEVIDDGVDGCLCPSGAPAGYVNRIRQLLDQPALARTIGEAARRKVNAQFSAGKMVADIERIYDRFLQ